MLLEIASVHRLLLNTKHTQFLSSLPEGVLYISPGIRITTSTSCHLTIVFKDESFCFAKTVRGREGGEENLLDILQMPDSSVFTVFHAPVALRVGVVISEIRKPGLRKAHRRNKDGAVTVDRFGVETQVHKTP